MTGNELAAKWYMKEHKIARLGDQIRALEKEREQEREEQRLLENDLAEHFITEDGQMGTKRVFLSPSDTFGAVIVEVCRLGGAAHVESKPVNQVGKHVELEDLGS